MVSGHDDAQWWEEVGQEKVAEALATELSDDEAFWAFNLAMRAPGPFRKEDILDAFRDPLSDGGFRALVQFLVRGFLVKVAGEDALEWSQEVKDRVKALDA